jgi:hypothetical protein
MAAMTFYIVGNLDTSVLSGVLNFAQQIRQPAAGTVQPTEIVIPMNSLGGDLGTAIASIMFSDR